MPLAPPTGVTAIPGNGQATVSWTPPASDGGSPITGYTVNSSGGQQCETIFDITVDDNDIECPVTSLTNGTAYTFTVTVTNAAGASTTSAPSASVTPSASDAVITSAPSSVVMPGKAVKIHFTATGTAEPTKSSAPWFSTSPLPTGLTLTPGTGTKADTASITGTAPAVGSYTFAVSASNAPGTETTQFFTLTVLGFTSSETSDTFIVGTPGSVTLTASGGNTVMSCGSSVLPAGVTCTGGQDATLTIAGTPTAGAAKPFSIKVTVTNATAKVSETFELTVDQAPSVVSAIQAATLADPVVVKASKGISISLTPAGFPAPTVTLAAAPSWLSVATNGKKISGITPSTGGTWTFTVSASNGVGSAATQTITIDALAITSAWSVIFTHSMANSFTVTTAGAPSDTVMAIYENTLASSFAFVDNGNGTATLSWTPASALKTPLEVTITATAGTVVVTQNLSVSVD